MNQLLIITAVAALLMTIEAEYAGAQSGRDWIAGNGVWSTPSNWSPNGVPTASEFGVFNSSAIVSMPNGTKAAGLVVGTSANLTLNGGGAESNATFVGAGAFFPTRIVEDATVTVSNGKFSFQQVDLGLDLSDQSGTLVIGEDAVWTSTETVLGRIDGTRGHIVVNGGRADFTVMAVGEFGSGTITLNGGRSDIGTLGIGSYSTGELTMRDGAVINSSTEGGDVLGINLGSAGVATVSGVGTLWNSGGLHVGEAGSGSLLVEAGGTVQTRSLALAFEAGSAGVVTATGMGSAVNIVTTGPSLVGLGPNGRIVVANDGAVNVGTGTGISGGMNVLTSGGLFGSGQIEGLLRNISGTVLPGDGVGRLKVAGSYEQSAGGRLLVDIAGNGLDQTDRLEITGPAVLSGIIDVQLLGGFSPAIGNEFVVLTAGSIVDNGLSLSPADAALFSLRVDAANSRVVIKRREPLQGDYDASGNVDGGDLLLWQRTFGAATPPVPADGNGNGIVDADDLTIWKNQFGTAGAGISSVNEVPEPRTVVITLVLAVGISARRRFLD